MEVAEEKSDTGKTLEDTLNDEPPVMSPGESRVPVISRENTTVVFANVGRLETEINFAHIRISVNLDDLNVLKDEVCAEIAHIDNITLTLLNDEKGSHIGRVFIKTLLNSMRTALELNCNHATERVILVEQIFQQELGKRSSGNTGGPVKHDPCVYDTPGVFPFRAWGHETYDQELDFRKYLKAKPCPLEEDPET